MRPNSQKLITLAIADSSGPAPMEQAAPACHGVSMKLTALGPWSTRAKAPDTALRVLGEMGMCLLRAVLEALIA